MHKKPRNPKKSLFADGLWLTILLEGGMIGALALVAFSVGFNIFSQRSIETARTMAFCVLSMSQLFHAFNMRSERSIFGGEFFANKMLILSLVLGISLQVLVVNTPALSAVFKVARLSFAEWAAVFGLALMPILIVELQKALSRK